MMGILHVTVKYTLFLVNLIFTLVSLALIVIGAIFLNHHERVLEELEIEGTLNSLLTAVIVFGCVVFLIAFSGCCGAVTETKIFLVSFIVLMTFIVAAEMYLAVVWDRDIDHMKSELGASLDNIFENAANNSHIHILELQLQCCGTTGPDFYEELPITCCSEDIINTQHDCILEYAFSIGCEDLLRNSIDNIGKTIKTVLIWAIVIEGLEIIGSIYLCISISKRRERVKNLS